MDHMVQAEKGGAPLQAGLEAQVCEYSRAKCSQSAHGGHEPRRGVLPLHAANIDPINSIRNDLFVSDESIIRVDIGK